jgi:hypothetical protein
MRDLTDKQIEKLYEMSDIHFKWFSIYSPESNIKYQEVLELNHNKILDILEGCYDCNEDVIDFIIESIIKDYIDLLNQVI